LSIAAGGVIFTQADISDRFPVAGPGAAVFFSQDLADGALPGIAMLLENSSAALHIGGTGSAPCGFSNVLEFDSRSGAFDTGIVAVSVTGFAGTPVAKTCRGRSTAALANRYTDLGTAAAALGYPSVKALQTAITIFCGR
jgi:hypothetical protein